MTKWPAFCVSSLADRPLAHHLRYWVQLHQRGRSCTVIRSADGAMQISDTARSGKAVVMNRDDFNLCKSWNLEVLVSRMDPEKIFCRWLRFDFGSAPDQPLWQTEHLTEALAPKFQDIEENIWQVSLTNSRSWEFSSGKLRLPKMIWRTCVFVVWMAELLCEDHPIEAQRQLHSSYRHPHFLKMLYPEASALAVGSFAVILFSKVG